MVESYIVDVKKWWEYLKEHGPPHGYFPKASKTWLVVKEAYYEKAKEMFPDINITTEGQRYLGSFIGTDVGKAIFVSRQVHEWSTDIKNIIEAAESEPHLAYSAYIYGVSKKWNYVMRTTPDISQHLRDIEDLIYLKLIPALTGIKPDENNRNIFALPARHGGLNLQNPAEVSDTEYENSCLMNKQLSEAITQQAEQFYHNDEQQHRTIEQIKKTKEERYKQAKFRLLSVVSNDMQRQVTLASEKGASSWLSALPLEDFGYVLNKQEFHDAIALRYNYQIEGASKSCACGKLNSPDHSLTCKLGGYVSLRHNTIRDTTAILLTKVCKDVKTEPALLPVKDEHYPPGSNTSVEARLDVSCRGLWAPLDKAFTDIRVLNPNAMSNARMPIKNMYKHHEDEKKRAYNARVINSEHATFTPLVFTTSGGMATECERFFKRLATLVAIKTNQRYCDTITHIRRRIRFDLLRTCLIGLRGHRGKVFTRAKEVEELDLNLTPDLRSEQ